VGGEFCTLRSPEEYRILLFLTCRGKEKQKSSLDEEYVLPTTRKREKKTTFFPRGGTSDLSTGPTSGIEKKEGTTFPPSRGKMGLFSIPYACEFKGPRALLTKENLWTLHTATTGKGVHMGSSLAPTSFCRERSEGYHFLRSKLPKKKQRSRLVFLPEANSKIPSRTGKRSSSSGEACRSRPISSWKKGDAFCILKEGGPCFSSGSSPSFSRRGGKGRRCPSRKKHL